MDIRQTLTTKEEIIHRIERFAFNYHGNGEHINKRTEKGDPVYWVGILDKPFTREFAFINYDYNLDLRFYLANNKEQGNDLYRGDYAMDILRTKSINIDGYKLYVQVLPTLKISNPWGKHIFDFNIHSTDKDTLVQLFEEFAGKHYSRENEAFIDSLTKYRSIIDVQEFIKKFDESYMNSEDPHEFLVSLSIAVWIRTPLDLIREIDAKAPVSEKDPLVTFVKKIEKTLLNLV